MGLSRDRFLALADEAERGYDVEHLEGRASRPVPAVKAVTVRLPADLYREVEVVAAAEQTSVSEVVREALRGYLTTREEADG